MLLQCQRNGSQRLASKLYAQILNHQRANHNDDEQRIVEEVLEHVQLRGLELSAVYLVEDLQQYEYVEEN